MAIIIGNLRNQISSNQPAQDDADSGRTPATHGGQATGISPAGGQITAPGVLGRAVPHRYLLVAGSSRRARQLQDAARNASATANTAGAMQENDPSFQGAGTQVRQPIAPPYAARYELTSSTHESSGNDPSMRGGESFVPNAGNRAANGASLVHYAGHPSRWTPADVGNLARLLTPEETEELSRLKPGDRRQIAILYEAILREHDRLNDEEDNAGNLSIELDSLRGAMDREQWVIENLLKGSLRATQNSADPTSSAPDRDGLRSRPPATDTSRPHASDATNPPAAGSWAKNRRIDDEPDTHPKKGDHSEFAEDFFRLFEGADRIQRMFMEMVLSWIRMIAEFSKKLNDIAVQAI